MQNLLLALLLATPALVFAGGYIEMNGKKVYLEDSKEPEAAKPKPKGSRSLFGSKLEPERSPQAGAKTGEPGIFEKAAGETGKMLERLKKQAIEHKKDLLEIDKEI